MHVMEFSSLLHLGAMILVMLLISVSHWSVTSLSTNNITDMVALLAFKSHITSDPYSILSSTWNTNTSFCNWTGVSCSNRRQRVTKLELRELSLQGTIAPQIANLSFLVSLDLSNNTLGGDIPDSLGQLPRLKFLNLSINEFSGSIPPQVFKMSSLQTIVLGYNKLSRHIPDNEALYLPRLQFLSLSYNQITGMVPTSLGLCQNLQTISLSHNEFIGSVPMELGNLLNLRILYLGANNLTGTIPPSLGNLTSLEVLSLSQNSLQGSIPIELGRLRNLQLLNLGQNSLTGMMPNEIFNISSLQKLQVSFNSLSGQLPKDIGLQLPNLQGLYISENQFNGEIPSSLSNASMLAIIEFSDNLLSGSVPTSLGDLRFLQTLSLQGNRVGNGLGFLASLTNCRLLENLLIGENKFGGELPDSVGNLSTNLLRFRAPNCQLKGRIPATLGNLSSLIYLNLHDNQLSGTIPPAIARLGDLQLIYLYINKLEGSIPDELCQLKYLSILFLYENILSGSVPDCIQNITGLQRLSLAANTLSSTIPSTIWKLENFYFLNLSLNSLVGNLDSEVGNLKALGQLDLSENRLNGSVPSTIGDLQMLKYLILSQNSFRGPIPQSFGQLINMEGMDLSSNELSGSIPKSLAQLRYFSFVNLSFNRLEGEIPHGGVFANLTADSFMGNTLLCGESKLGVQPCKASLVPKSKRTRHLKYILPVVASVLVSAACCFCLFLSCRKKKLQIPVSVDEPKAMEQRRISYQELVHATENFSESNLLGVGTHGSVYKGKLNDSTLAAVKVLNLESEGALRSFDAECEVLRNVRHRNLVKIISICSNFDFKALVLQFMSNGSLEKWLHSEECSLTLIQRVEIMLDVALALEYFHHEYSEVVVHCDLKPSNVLLDENLTAHVGDFGIAKLLASDERSIVQSTAPGTIGYMAPEYGSEGRVSAKGDVYSYGILLLETFTGKKPTDEIFVGVSSLRQWVNDAFPDSILEVVDGNLLGEESSRVHYDIKWEEGGQITNYKSLSSVMELGLMCSRESPKERINMKDVTVRLRKIKVELGIGTSSRNAQM